MDGHRHGSPCHRIPLTGHLTVAPTLTRGSGSGGTLVVHVAYTSCRRFESAARSTVLDPPPFLVDLFLDLPTLFVDLLTLFVDLVVDLLLDVGPSTLPRLENDEAPDQAAGGCISHSLIASAVSPDLAPGGAVPELLLSLDHLPARRLRP